ncbi:BgTH12-04930 [Blumeria graminis f. sp. triticale]|uniref:BgTH12-04930 n=1 Tax=Blumeria graminis f. sp. triticale TaxID=1689686 RepID=A0A9W4D5K1_BLUGR|nr:BgTH12-04930 [Blumeria graminis f. sp. triticale]
MEKRSFSRLRLSCPRCHRRPRSSPEKLSRK